MKQFAYIYRLTNSEGLKYIGSHLVLSNKTIYSDKYCGSSSDPRINSGIVCKEILCYIHGYKREELYSRIQKLEHELILDLDAINNPEYANATTCGVIGLNYKRLGAIASAIKQKDLWEHDKIWRNKVSKNKSEAQKEAYKERIIKTGVDWHRQGQKISAKSKRDDWNETLFNKLQQVYKKYPSKKAYALWTTLGKPTKNYKSIFHMLNHIKEGRTWQDIK